MHPPLLYNPRAKANLKRKDMAPAHCMLWGEGDTHLSHALHLSHTHTRTHKQILSMHARLCPSAPKFLCQWVYISSSLWMFSEQREVQSPLTERHSDVHRHIKRFVFTLFGFTLFFASCRFLVFEPRSVFKEEAR